MELFHSNIWWSKGLELIGNGFTNDRALELHHKGIQWVEDIGAKSTEHLSLGKMLLPNSNSLVGIRNVGSISLLTSSISGGACWKVTQKP